MAAPKKDTELAGIHKAACAAMALALRGEPLLNRDGEPVLNADGTPFMVPPSAATLRAVTEFLKQHGIDEELTEGSGILEVAKAARAYDDHADDPFLLDSK
jgi:hypothetical protein